MSRRGWARWAGTLAALATGGALLPASASTGSAQIPVLGPPITQPQCRTLSATVTPFVPSQAAGPLGILEPGGPRIAGQDWLEQLAFDGHGRLWTSRMERNQLEAYDATGRLVKTLAVAAPEGMVTGADGLVYVATGDAGGSTGVVRFDPAQASPTLQTYVNGLPAANALDFDATGSLYVTTEALGLGGGAAPSVLRVRPDGSRDTVWENAAGIWGANGVVAKGGDVFATVSFDQRSPIWEIPIADPAGRFILTELSLGALSTQPALFLPPKLGAPLIPKGLDDLTVGPDGALWVAAFSAGEVLRVDPGSGRACVVASGLVSPTAIRFPVAFGGWSPTRDAFVTEAAGELLRVHVTPAP